MLSDTPRVPAILPEAGLTVLEIFFKDMESGTSRTLQVEEGTIFDIGLSGLYRSTVQLNPLLFRVTVDDREIRDRYMAQAGDEWESRIMGHLRFR
jgi:hypothetical protein